MIYQSVFKKQIYILFADDTSLMYLSSNIKDLFNTVNTDANLLFDWFNVNKLTLRLIIFFNSIVFTQLKRPICDNLAFINADIVTEKQQISF